MVKVGDRATEYVDAVGKTLTGRVVYVHPENRYYVVEFAVIGGSFRESFYGLNRRGTK